MTARLLNGKDLALQRRAQLKSDIATKVDLGYARPQLAVILIGDDPASAIYVTNKRKACEDVGIESHSYHLPESTSQGELLHLINELNHKDNISGILIQLPLPKHINTSDIIEHIDPEKDVDGFHPYNLGRLAQRLPCLRPCTPLGIIHLLEHYDIPIRGQHAVIVGASNIVGRPMSLELLLAGATVTICHKFTKNLQSHVEMANIIVVAAGKKNVINVDWLSSHQVLVDVGIHRLEDGRICGDVDMEKASKKVAWITPVPGGVGPMTIVTLLENTFFACYLPKVIQESSF